MLVSGRNNLRSPDPCLICGNCWWTRCDQPADYEFDVHLKREGRTVFDGVVDLCTAHAKHAAKTGHVNIDWRALEQALARRAS